MMVMMMMMMMMIMMMMAMMMMMMMMMMMVMMIMMMMVMVVVVVVVKWMVDNNKHLFITLSPFPTLRFLSLLASSVIMIQDEQDDPLGLVPTTSTPSTSTSVPPEDMFEDLHGMEESWYQQGYDDGARDGAEQGRIDGRETG